MILYTVLARSSDGVILTEACTAGLKGNHPQVTTQLVSSISSDPISQPEGNRQTFVSNADLEGATMLDHFYHILVGQEVIYVCLSDDTTDRGQSV